MRKYYLNVDYFEKIDTQEKAYWLGFISADGSVGISNKETNSHRLTISLHEKDKNILLKFREALKSNYPIRKRITNKGKKFESHQYFISVNSIKICKDLMKHGVVPNKTYNLNPPNIEKSLIVHYFRGYFDGDGCWYYKKYENRIRVSFEIVSMTSGILEYFQSFLKDNNINTKIYTRKSNNTKRLMTSSIPETCKIINLIYKYSEIHLERKYVKAQEILQLAV